MPYEIEYPGMDEDFRYNVQEFTGFRDLPLLPDGRPEPREVRVSFYMDYLCWCELENSPIWSSVADHVRGHQTERNHMQLLTPSEIWAEAEYNDRSGHLTGRGKGVFDRFRRAFSSIRSLVDRQNRA